MANYPRGGAATKNIESKKVELAEKIYNVDTDTDDNKADNNSKKETGLNESIIVYEELENIVRGCVAENLEARGMACDAETLDNKTNDMMSITMNIVGLTGNIVEYKYINYGKVKTIVDDMFSFSDKIVENKTNENRFLPKNINLIGLKLPAEIPDEQKYDTWRETNGPHIVKFLDTGWPAPFVEAKMLTRPILKKLDPAAWQAHKNLLARKLLPKRLQLLDRSEAVTEKLSYVDKEKLRETGRLASALRSRERGK